MSNVIEEDDYIGKISFHLYNSIKVSISLYHFRKKLLDKIQSKKNISNQKIILIDKNWFSSYKKFYFCEEVIKLIKDNKLSLFSPGIQKLLFNNIFSTFKRYIHKKKSSNLLLFYNKKDEFPKVKYYHNNSNFSFISDFEIINEEIYANLKKHLGDFNIPIPYNNKNFDYIIYNEKLIIKYINTQEAFYNLLIGRFDENSYIPEIFVNYYNQMNLEEEFRKLFDPSNNILLQYIEGDIKEKKIKDITKEINIENNNSFNIKHFLNGFSDINNKNNKNIKNKDLKKEEPVIDCNKIVKFFVKLFLEYKNIKKKLNENAYYEIEYNLINQNWIYKFKDKFCYYEFESIIKSNGDSNIINEKDIDSFSKNIIFSDYLNKLKKLEIDDIIYELSNINLFSLNYDYCNKDEIKYNDYIKIYKNFELWTKETLSIFKDIGFCLNFEPKLVKCFLDENFIFILTRNKLNTFLNIYQLNEPYYFEPKMVIKCDKIKVILESIKKGSFIKYLYSITSINSRVININQKEDKGVAYLLSREGRIHDKVKKKAKRFDIIINFLICNQEIKRKMQKSVKENFSKNHNSKEKFYLISYKLIKDYIKLSGLSNVYTNLENFLKNKNFPDDFPIEERIKEIKRYINEKLNDHFPNKFEYQSNLSAKFNSEKSYDETDYIIVKNHKEQIYYHNNYCLLNEKIVESINENYKIHLLKYDCLIGDNRIFIMNNSNFKNLIEIGTFNNNVFQIELIIDIFKNYKEEEQKIIEYKYQKYFKSSFVFTNYDIVSISPLFDDKNELKGYGYLKGKNPFNIKVNNDFSDYIYNNNLIKIIYLIIGFNNYQNNLKKNESSYYFLISINWINLFKEKYYYEETKKAINENNSAKNILNSFIEENNKSLNKKENSPMLKKIFLLINNIPEINKFYNDNQEKMIIEEFQIIEPNLEVYENDRENYPFTIYNHFILIETKIFEKIYDIKGAFSQNFKSKNNYRHCFYAEDLMFIELNKLVTGLDKMVIEVGYIDYNNNNTFILNYLIIFDKGHYYKDFLDYLKEYGYQKYFGMFQFGGDNVKPLNLQGKKIGYICKYDKNINNRNNEEIKSIQQDFSNNNKSNPLNPKDSNSFGENYISIRLKFSETPKIGLQNVGATCYMNATIQCFGQIEKLVDYIKYNKRIINTIEKYKKNNENCLTESFKILIENLWPTDKKYIIQKYNLKNTNNKYFVPKEFKKKISKMNNLFEGAKANDSKDLVNFIIMRLHEELNEKNKSENINNNDNNPPNQEEEISMLNYFRENYFRDNKSIISDLFYGINGTMYQCSRCQTKKFNYQITFFYIFPLEEVRKFKIQNLQQIHMNKISQQFQMQMQMGQNMGYMNLMLLCQPYFSSIQNINSVNLNDCFDYNQKIELMSGQNSMYCNICKNQESAYYQTYIVNSPEIIIIILNRGKGIEFNVKLEFSEFLNIKNYVKDNDSPYNYELIGVVTHLGESGASGHFIAYCRSPIEKDKWYNYNDDLCFLVTNLKEQVIDYGMPYILFYQKVNNS